MTHENGDHPVARGIENVGFICGIVLAFSFVLTESLRRVGICGAGGCPAGGVDFLYATIVLSLTALLIAPKMLGKQTAGKVWTGLVDKMPSIASKAKTLTGIRPAVKPKDKE